MLSAAMPLSSAKATAASSTLSLLRGVRAHVAGLVFLTTCSLHVDGS
jgi:hypothetical protein